LRQNTGRERRPEPPSIERLQALRQVDEVWGVIARRARGWVDPDDAPPYRPHIIVVGIAGSRQVLRRTLVDDPPGAGEVEATLLAAMSHPALFTGRSRRPAIVESDDEALVAALTPRLARIGVRCRYRSALLELDRARADLERRMVGAPTPGLLSVPGVTEPQARRLFALAAEYHARAPRLPQRPPSDRDPLPAGRRAALRRGHGQRRRRLRLVRQRHGGRPRPDVLGAPRVAAPLRAPQLDGAHVRGAAGDPLRRPR